jgi:coupling of ubiquitin conjugation to ER degradation protein 1
LLQAPPSFQPVIPASTNIISGASAASGALKKAEPDLITRYNLQSQVNSKGKEKEQPPAVGWASNKEKRQEMLRRRRDEMILAAREKMLEKDRQGAGSS